MSAVVTVKRSTTVGLDRAPSAPYSRFAMTPNRIGLLLVILLCAIVVHTASDYGVAWDDAVQTEYGRLALNYFLSAGRDTAASNWLDLRYYGPVVELPIAAISRLCSVDLISIRHTICGLIGLLAVPPLIRFGQIIGLARGAGGLRAVHAGAWVGLIAAVFLWTMPRFYGHAFLNSKDIPFAVGMTASLALLAEMFARGRFRWRELLRCGLLLGLTTAIRPGGWMLIGPYYAAMCAYQDWFMKRPTRPSSRTIYRQAAMFSLAWVVMTLPWPWAHESPIKNPIQAIRQASKFHIVVPVLFEGTVYSSDALPRDYLVKFIAYTTPPAILLLAAMGVIAAVRTLLTRMSRPRSIMLFTLLIWPAVPLLLFAAMRPNAYDGLRHFLFVLPAIALLAAFGASWVWRGVEKVCGQRLSRVFAVGTLTIVILPQVQTIARLHPYQLTYFNMFAGGMQDADQRFETDYWLTSYKAAMSWIRQQPHESDVSILVAGNDHSVWCAEYFATPGMKFDATLTSNQAGDVPTRYDYYIGTTRCGMHDNFPEGEIVFSVGRVGATFAVVKQSRREQRP